MTSSQKADDMDFFQQASGRRALAFSLLLTIPLGPTPARGAERPLGSEQTVRIAGIVLKWVRGDKEANYRRCEPMIREAAARGAKIVCTTECFLDGYAIADQDLPLATYLALGEEIPSGTYCKRLASLARELKIHLVAGMVEADGKSRYNTAVILGPDGKLLGKYRKQKLGPDSSRVAAGNKAPVVETAYGSIGVLIDGERTDPGVVRRFYEDGAHVLLCPAGASWGPLENLLKVQARSRENKLFIVSVHPAAFLVTGPDGTTRKRETLGERLLVTREESGGEHDQNGVVYFDLPTRPRNAATEIGNFTFRPMEGQALFYRSRIYGDLQPLAVCATDVSSTPKPLLVQLTSLAFAKQAAQDCEATCRLARDHGLDCVVLGVDGRGGGSLHQGYGEVDVYEAIEAVRKKLAIDPERMSVTGSSVGGAATWYHASHYPDFWAAAGPSFGYCDHKIWENASLSPFPMQPWEEPSWIARGAAYRAANLRHVSLRITHGEWDRAIAGGVPVEHSRQMDRKLTELGIPHIYVEVPKTGHADSASLRNETILWLLKQHRVKDPNHVSLVVHTLRHHRSHWVAVEQQRDSGRASTVEARRQRIGNTIAVTTANVRRIALGPLPKATGIALEVDGSSFPRVDLTTEQHFTRSADGSWSRAGGTIPAGEKRPGLSGPFADLFIAPTIIVYGLSGSEAAAEFNEQVAFGIARQFSQSNGGLHRGSIPGNNNVLLPIVSDRRLLELLADKGPAGPVDLDSRLVGDYAKVSLDRDTLRRANLFLIGNVDSNAVLAKLAPQLPVAFGLGKLTLGGKTFTGDHLACFAMFPHPDGGRYVALLSGNEPDAICWGSRVGLQLLPDYLVFDHARVVEWGFWNNRWRHTE
jgi:predicted amidohydrolase